MYMRNFGEFFENQLQYARTIILSRTDTPKATEEKVAKAVALIREVNKDAVIITTPIEKLDGAQILEAMEQGREEDEDFCPVCGGHHDHEHHHHHADEVFTSWGKETPHKFTKAKIEDVLKTLCETDDYGTILRAKGMVEDENGSWIYFDMVPGEYELRDGEPDYTGRLCVIGTDIDEHRLEELFGIA